MGLASLLWIYENPLEDLRPQDASWNKMCSLLGEAILRLTHDIGYFANPDGTRRRSHSLGHTGSAVNFCDQADSADERLYVWSGNRLVALSGATENELTFAADAVAAESMRRRAQAGGR